MGDDVVVRTVFGEVQPFKGVKNYLTDSLLYQDDIETNHCPMTSTVAMRRTQNQKKMCQLLLVY